ncbi:MAG TPA: hypothetical protein VJ885_11030 [Thermoanaerobaculia bacterium]|nr:hypothetical protein [Thermoanaerobaculia bacterium]
MEQAARSPRGTVEDLLRRIDGLTKTEDSGGVPAFELWVPGRLTLRGQTIPSDVAQMVLLDALLERDFEPTGFVEEDGGKLYRYERSTGH